MIELIENKPSNWFDALRIPRNEDLVRDDVTTVDINGYKDIINADGHLAELFASFSKPFWMISVNLDSDNAVFHFIAPSTTPF